MQVFEKAREDAVEGKHKVLEFIRKEKEVVCINHRNNVKLWEDG